MQTLRALLSASPQYFQVYRTCREVVLLHVARNHIPPTVVSIALRALEQRDFRKHGLHLTKQTTSPRTLIEPYEIPLETWKPLFRFHQIIDRLISNFTSSRLVAIENSLHPQTQTFLPHDPPSRQLSLSQLEYARLARAFYHLELFADFHQQHGSARPARNFLESLRDFELE